MSEEAHLNGEAIAGFHCSRFLVHYNAYVSRRAFDTGPFATMLQRCNGVAYRCEALIRLEEGLDLRTWYIHGLRWNSRPIPWPVNIGETQ